MRLIDIEAEVCADCVCRDKCDRQAYCWTKAMQTVDAVVVVRCRDCKYFMEYTREYARNADGADGDCYIRVMNSCNEQFRSCNYDDFCSYGERKEGAEC